MVMAVRNVNAACVTSPLGRAGNLEVALEHFPRVALGDDITKVATQTCDAHLIQWVSQYSRFA